MTLKSDEAGIVRFVVRGLLLGLLRRIDRVRIDSVVEMGLIAYADTRSPLLSSFWCAVSGLKG